MDTLTAVEMFGVEGAVALDTEANKFADANTPNETPEDIRGLVREALRYGFIVGAKYQGYLQRRS